MSRSRRRPLRQSAIVPAPPPEPFMPPRAEGIIPIAALPANTRSVERQQVIDRELLLKEAEWVWSEMEDFVKQIQRYRLTYVTALFASIGWVLGQLVDPANAAFSLDQIRANSAIASVILLIPMLNGLFFILVMESARQLQSLARYRFLLGCALDGDRPVWRWELFKLTKEGSIRSWTNPSNIFLGVFALFASIGAFIFVNPAVGSPVVNVLRWVSGTYTAALAVAVTWAGWIRRHENDVADEPTDTTYETLRPSWAARLNLRQERGQS